MTQWLVLYSKEMTEMWRSYKWIWVPIVFVLLGVSQPVVSYYLPDILKSAGNLPEGAVIQIPVPSAPQVLAETLSQYNTLGVLILVLSFMGVISAERQSGAAGLVLIKPVPFASYITAKWAGAFTLTVASFGLGYAASWYYTVMLIGSVEPVLVLKSFLLYGLWLLFVVTITVMLSAAMKGSGGIAFLSLGFVALLSILNGLIGKYMKWSPSTLPGHAGSILSGGEAGDLLPLAIIVTAVAIVAMLGIAVHLFGKKELLS